MVGNDVWTFNPAVDCKIELEVVANQVREVHCVPMDSNDASLAAEKSAATTYQRDGWTYVNARELLQSYREHGYCNEYEAMEILGDCHKDEVLADDTYISGLFECYYRGLVTVWKQNSGNLAVLADDWWENPRVVIKKGIQSRIPFFC